MADSTRRSGRATKGQHSKNLEPEEPPPAPKRGGKGRKKNAPEPEEEEEETEAIIRCVCGCTTEDDDDDQKMIMCDNCQAWQHNECMEVSTIDEELPEQYYCEQCRPSHHKALLAKIARGEKPWEERAKQRELEEEEARKNRKGRGKKGKRGRPSTVKKEQSETNGTAEKDEIAASQVEEPSEIVPPSPVVDNNKRKLPDQADTKAADQIEPPSKTRKVSSPPSPPKHSTPISARRRSSGQPIVKRDSTGVTLQTELVANISDLQSEERRRAAAAMVKLLIDETKKAEKAGSFILPPGQSIEEFGLRLGLSVEFALYLNYWGNNSKASEQYGDKFRAILHNVKANSLLRDRILTGTLPPNELSKMSRDDMASKELQEKKAEMLKEAEKQHMLVQEEGPRIRRTHKGEELVDDQSHIADGSHTAFTAPIRKRPSEIDTTMKDVSPEPTSAVSTAAVELPPNIEAGSPPAVTHQSAINNVQASPQQSPAPDRSSTTKFDIQNVLSQIKGQESEAQRQRPNRRQSDAAAATAHQIPQQADAEIDRLLKDEEPEDDEPYSPKEFTSETASGVVWHGSLGMPGVASFRGTAKHCAGADLSSTLPWNELIPANLGIQGRIDVDRASTYLCGLKWSTTTDLVVVSVTPDGNESDTTQFNKLYRYFTERNRYGVISKDPNLSSSIRDIYLIPIDAGTTKKPEFIELLDVCTLEDPVPERMLLLSFVVKLSNSPSQQTPRHPDAASMASPIGNAATPVAPLGSHSAFQNGSTPSNLPYPGQPYPPYAGSPLSNQQPPYGTPTPGHLQQSMFAPPVQQSAGPIGIDAARVVLGDLSDSPTVSALLAEAPRTSVQEFNVIKGLFEQNPSLRDNYGALKDTMTRQYHNG